MSSIQQAMQTLNAQWYNAIITGCKLDPNTFQLSQANTPLGSTSSSLWQIYDAIPPLSVNNYFNPTQFNSFSGDYGAVVNNLVPQGGNTFQKDMGDYYSQWTAYLKTNPALPAGQTITAQMLALFQKWAAMNMPPNQAQKCYTDYQQIANGAIPTAVGMWSNMVNAAAPYGNVAAYNGTIDQVNAAITGSPGSAATMNSKTTSSDVSNTWARGSVTGAFDWFWGQAGGNYDKWTQQITTAGVNIQASFDHLIQFPMAPLSQPSSDPILGNYTPWFDFAALSLAYHTQDNTVWIAGSHPTWADTFGPTGNMQRVCGSLVIVDGITITQQSNAGISQSEQEQFQAAAEVGFWPFFKAESQGGWSHQFNFDDQGNFTVQSTCPAGNPNILGVIVTPISSFFAAMKIAMSSMISAETERAR